MLNAKWANDILIALLGLSATMTAIDARESPLADISMLKIIFFTY